LYHIVSLALSRQGRMVAMKRDNDIIICIVQNVLWISLTLRQWMAATRWWIVTWNGQSLDYIVGHYIKMLIFWSSMIERNRWQLHHFSIPTV